MNIRDIQAFVTAVDLGSIQRAAARLHLTQPGISRRIQALESTLSLELLDRRAKPVRPSASGLHILAACRQVLQAAKTIQLLALPNGEPAGEFRLGIAPGLADVVLSEPLDRLRHRFTALRPSITTAWTAELVENVRSGVLHAAIVLWLNDLTIPTNQTTVVGREDIVVVAARTRPLKKRLTIRDLAAEPWILNPVGCGYRRNLERALEAAGLPLLIAAEATGRDLQLSLIARDLGIGLIPQRIFDQSRYRTKIRALQVRDLLIRAKRKVNLR